MKKILPLVLRNNLADVLGAGFTALRFHVHRMLIVMVVFMMVVVVLAVSPPKAPVGLQIQLCAVIVSPVGIGHHEGFPIFVFLDSYHDHAY